jgi:hypothetical protein
MATNEPMSDERLAGLAERVKNIRHMQQVGPRNLSNLERWQLQSIAVAYADDVSDLLAENDRLRAREQALEAENAAMRPIVEAVADIENSDGSACYVTCDLTLFDAELDPPDDVRHNEPCLIEQARVFVAAHPATRPRTRERQQRVRGNEHDHQQ